jgi:hypothetical protein
MKGAAPLFVVSWVLLLLLAAAITILSVTSTMGAYGGAPDNITGAVTVEQAGSLGPDVAEALRGRRATAATWALAFGLLAGYVVLVPYRRGERWAWWAILVALGLSQLLSIARVVALGRTQGAGTSGILLAIGLLGLMAGAPKLFMARDTEA